MRYYCVFFTLCLSYSFFKGISRVVTFLHCSIFKMLFFFALAFRRKLFHYITSFRFCQVLFSSFFQKLFDVIANLFSRPAFLLYHISFILSSAFSSFFQNLFEMFAFRLADSLFIISHIESFVKYFFENF